MQFFRRAAGSPRRLGVLPGTFNPPTVAHLALARAALAVVDEVLLVLPRIFPHKQYEGASFDERVELLQLACAADPQLSTAAPQGGLFIEIARECRAAYGDRVRLSFVCGRDAAERIVGWDYGEPGAIADILREFDLLVAAREGEYRIPAEHASAIEVLSLPGSFDHVSATEVRNRIQSGKEWAQLVPRETVQRIREIYAPNPLHLG
jgi:nicotinate-nucleotide adenylyltransferase